MSDRTKAYILLEAIIGGLFLTVTKIKLIDISRLLFLFLTLVLP